MWRQMLAVCVSSVSRSLTLFSVSLCIMWQTVCYDACSFHLILSSSAVMHRHLRHRGLSGLRLLCLHNNMRNHNRGWWVRLACHVHVEVSACISCLIILTHPILISNHINAPSTHIQSYECTPYSYLIMWTRHSYLFMWTHLILMLNHMNATYTYI